MPHLLASTGRPVVDDEEHIELHSSQRLLTLVMDLSAKMDILLERSARDARASRKSLSSRRTRVVGGSRTGTTSLHAYAHGTAGNESSPQEMSVRTGDVALSVVPAIMEDTLELDSRSTRGTADTETTEPPRPRTSSGPRTMTGIRSTLQSATRVLQRGRLQLASSAQDLMEAMDMYRQRATKRQKVLSGSNFFRPIVTDPRFDAFIIFMVLFNGVMISLQVNEQALYGSEASIYKISENICSVIFAVELLIRVLGLGSALCWREHRHWAVMDTILVVVSMADFILASWCGGTDKLADQNSSVGNIIKVSRVIRVLRVFRMLRFLARVRLMVVMIAGSLVSLFWLFVLLLVGMYGFGIVLTQGATSWRRPPIPDPSRALHPRYMDATKSFGSVPDTMYTLFISMTGGVSWGEPAGLALEFGFIYFCIFFFYMFFAYFSVLNIVTGVFVDGAIQQANSDRSLRLLQDEETRKAYRDDLRELLLRLDADHDGRVTHDEWRIAIRQGEVRSLLAAIEIKDSDAIELFQMLDADGDGELTVAELIEGMERLRGGAQNFHVQEILWMLKRLMRKLQVDVPPAHKIQSVLV